MIVSTTVDEAGVTVTIDSDGDQGSGYAPEVLTDMLLRASQHAVSMWLAVVVEHADEAPEADGD